MRDRAARLVQAARCMSEHRSRAAFRHGSMYLRRRRRRAEYQNDRGHHTVPCPCVRRFGVENHRRHQNRLPISCRTVPRPYTARRCDLASDASVAMPIAVLTTVSRSRPSASAFASSRIDLNPFCPAVAICRSVTGEQLPETTSKRSRLPIEGAGGGVAMTPVVRHHSVKRVLHAGRSDDKRSPIPAGPQQSSGIEQRAWSSVSRLRSEHSRSRPQSVPSASSLLRSRMLNERAGKPVCARR